MLEPKRLYRITTRSGKYSLEVWKHVSETYNEYHIEERVFGQIQAYHPRPYIGETQELLQQIIKSAMRDDHINYERLEQDNFTTLDPRSDLDPAALAQLLAQQRQH